MYECCPQCCSILIHTFVRWFPGKQAIIRGSKVLYDVCKTRTVFWIRCPGTVEGNVNSMSTVEPFYPRHHWNNLISGVDLYTLLRIKPCQFLGLEWGVFTYQHFTMSWYNALVQPGGGERQYPVLIRVITYNMHNTRILLYLSLSLSLSLPCQMLLFQMVYSLSSISHTAPSHNSIHHWLMYNAHS